ncbi:hypothetical protein ANO11243_062280 [Dothideomycetidae sp. 11243]|nr:hypothetical protein ANO11243_062280 [fungal sp. No.11243]
MTRTWLWGFQTQPFGLAASTTYHSRGYGHMTEVRSYHCRAREEGSRPSPRSQRKLGVCVMASAAAESSDRKQDVQGSVSFAAPIDRLEKGAPEAVNHNVMLPMWHGSREEQNFNGRRRCFLFSSLRSIVHDSGQPCPFQSGSKSDRGAGNAGGAADWSYSMLMSHGRPPVNHGDLRVWDAAPAANAAGTNSARVSGRKLTPKRRESVCQDCRFCCGDVILSKRGCRLFALKAL